MIHILNQHDLGSALVCNLFALTVSLRSSSLRKLQSVATSGSVRQPCYKMRQRAEIETENK